MIKAALLSFFVGGSYSSGTTAAKTFGTAKLTLVVDAATGVNRVVSYTGGDFSASPFSTIQSAVSALPLSSAYRRIVKINASGSAYAGYQANGFSGAGDVVLLFATTAPTLTGLTTGTCGGGTTTTQCSVASGNWGSDTLRQYFVTFANANDPDLSIVRPIKSKTSTTLTFDTVAGLTNGATFNIVKTATTLAAGSSPYAGNNVGGVHAYNSSPIRVYYAAPAASLDYGLLSTGNALFDAHALKLANASTYQTVYSTGDLYSVLNDSYASAGASLQQQGGTIELQNDVSGGTAVASVVGANSAIVQFDALSVTGIPLTVKRVNNVLVGFNGASTTGAEAALFDSCTSLTQQNAGLTGASNSAYGVEFTNGGQYSVSGASITGASGDFTIDGSTSASQTWANLATYKAMSRYGGGTLLLAGSTAAEMYVLESLLINGSNLDVSNAQEQHGGRVINYGYFHFAAGSSFDAVTAHAGGGCGSATAIGLGATRVGTAGSNGDTVKLNTGVIGGITQFIANPTAKSVGICPPTGGKVNAAGTDTAVSLPAGDAAFCMSRDDSSSGNDFFCWIGVMP